jgi:hypothetical protein
MHRQFLLSQAYEQRAKLAELDRQTSPSPGLVARTCRRAVSSRHRDDLVYAARISLDLRQLKAEDHVVDLGPGIAVMESNNPPMYMVSPSGRCGRRIRAIERRGMARSRTSTQVAVPTSEVAFLGIKIPRRLTSFAKEVTG